MMCNPVLNQRILGIVISLLLVGCAPERDAGSTPPQSAPEQTDQRAVGTGDLTRIVFREISQGESFATEEGGVEVTQLSTDADALRGALAVERDFLITLLGRDIRLHPDPESAFTRDTGGKWSGDVMADSVVLGPAVFIARENRVYATVNDGEFGYELVSTDGGATFNVREIDIEALPDEAPAEVPPDAVEDLSALDEADANTIHQIDVLLLYSSELADRLKKAKINIADYVTDRQDILDRVYENGANKLPVRVRITHYEEYKDALPNTKASPLLAQLASDPDVKKLRNDHDADLVALLVVKISDACGVGYISTKGSKSAAFSVTREDCEFKFTLAHEIGHNLGAEHVRGKKDNDPNRCNYAHRIPSVARTLMAYECKASERCDRQRYFSDTAVKFVDSAGKSHVMGIACNKTNAASNVETVRAMLAKVAAYEP